MRILIADDHAIVRKGVIELLRAEFLTAEIQEVSNGADALFSVTGSNNWDLIIMDISMPEKNGIEALKEIRTAGINTPVLMFSMQPEDQYAIRAMKIGASGFVNKESATDELIIAVRKVLSGGKYISSSIDKKISTALLDNQVQNPLESLSDRELQVLQLIASGKTVTDIAEHIKLSVTTVSTYRTRILEKLSLSNNAELTRYAINNGIM